MSKYKVEVCKVKDVVNHPNADRLDIVTVKGWKCITGRDDFVIGDLVVFVPPDSLVTDKFVEKFNIAYLKGKGARKRVGTIKLRGEWSEGLVVPAEDGWDVEGSDVAEHYNITKYEPVHFTKYPKQSRRGDRYMSEVKRRYAASFPKYTDIENVRNYPEILEDDELLFAVEKVHGTNFRAGWVKDVGFIARVLQKVGITKWKFLIGSRNVILDDGSTTYYGENVYAWIAKKYSLKTILPKGIIVYGEIYGKTLSGGEIQKNYSYGAKEPEAVFFDIMKDDKYLPLHGACALLDLLVLPIAPVVGVYSVQEILDKHTISKSAIDDTTEREGLVIRPLKERTHPRLGRVILKVISPAYLAQKERTEGH